MNKSKSMQEKHITKWKAFIALSIILSGLLGVFISRSALKPLNESQWQYCESIAKDVYYQKMNNAAIIDLPEDIYCEIKDTEIRVKLDLHVGEVVAKVKKGDLVFERIDETSMHYLFVTLCGILFALFDFMILCFLVPKIYELKI